MVVNDDSPGMGGGSIISPSPPPGRPNEQKEAVLAAPTLGGRNPSGSDDRNSRREIDPGRTI